MRTKRIAEREYFLHARAGEIAKMAMGRTENPGRGKRKSWRAEEDPLAWWCLVELLVLFAKDPYRGMETNP
jgi:hypothetical protein